MSDSQSTLGKTQAMILALLWNGEMYGLEIQKFLLLKGLKVSKSQLYQALNKLEQKGLLTSRIEIIPGANRKFYTITDEGKVETKLYIQPIFNVMSELFYDVIDEIFDYIKDILPSDPNFHILEISESTLPLFLSYFSQILSKKGRYNLFLHTKEIKDIIIERFKSLEFEKYANVIERKNTTLDLSNGSIDFILIPFYLHNDGTDWVLDEVHRVLKVNGQVLLFDVEEMAENLLANSLFKLLSNHSKYGVNSKEIKLFFSKNYTIEHYSHYKGIFFVKAKKK